MKKLGPQRKAAPGRRKRAYELRQKGKSWNDIANTMKCSAEAAQALVRRYRKLNGIPDETPDNYQAMLALPVDEMTKHHLHWGQRASIERIERQQRAADLRHQDKSWKEIAQEIGTTPSGAHAMATSFTPKKIRVLRNLKRAAREKERRYTKSAPRIFRLRQKKKSRYEMSWEVISEKTGIPPSTAYRYYHRYLKNPF